MRRSTKASSSTTRHQLALSRANKIITKTSQNIHHQIKQSTQDKNQKTNRQNTSSSSSAKIKPQNPILPTYQRQNMVKKRSNNNPQNTNNQPPNNPRNRHPHIPRRSPLEQNPMLLLPLPITRIRPTRHNRRRSRNHLLRPTRASRARRRRRMHQDIAAAFGGGAMLGRDAAGHVACLDRCRCCHCCARG